MPFNSPRTPLAATMDSLARAAATEGDLLISVGSVPPGSRRAGMHSHSRGQLLGATGGQMTLDVADARCVVPSAHALWLPPRIPHGLTSYGEFSGWSVYVAEEACVDLPPTPRVMGISGLLREAVGRALRWHPDAKGLEPMQARLAAVVLDEIRTLAPAALALPMPAEPRMLQMARALTDDPSDSRGLDEWAAEIGMTSRTLSRRFVQETGLTLTAWRQRVRLLRSLELLAEGSSIKATSISLGYSNVSAFIALFKRTFGSTPGRYLADDIASNASGRPLS